MLGWLDSLLRRKTPEREYISLRAYQAGQINRLNQGRWPTGGNTSFDADLRIEQENLRSRTKHELQNNGILEGVIFTHVNDIVGADGPTLNVESDNAEFNDRFEAIWRAVWAMPDLAGQESGAEMLAAAVRGLWHSGCYLAQITRDDEASMAERRRRDPLDVLGQIAVRLYDIHPRRLSNPTHALANDRFCGGIERDARGRILNYWIADEFANDPTVFLGQNWTSVAAGDMIHVYAKKEAGQTNGAPVSAPALETISGLHDLDDAVLEAARGQTYASIILTASDPDKLPAQVPTGTVSIKKNSIMAAPPGYQATGFTPTQPTIQYIPYRHERLREIGRPVGMPLMMVLLDSSGHNYSSARFDNQVYLRGIECFRAQLRRKVLDRFAREVLREARAGGLVGAVPDKFRLVWHWPATPHVDPSKEFKGDEGELKTGLATLTQKTAERGRVFDLVLADLDKEIAAFDARGIVHPVLLESRKLQAKAEAAAAGNANNGNDAGSDDADDDEEDEDERAEAIRGIVREEIAAEQERAAYSGDLFASVN